MLSLEGGSCWDAVSLAARGVEFRLHSVGDGCVRRVSEHGDGLI